jgi:hypothetical protein
MLRRALDRQAARRAADAQAAEKDPPLSWLGGNMCARVETDALGVLAALFGEQYQNLMQVRSWGNIPVLNEWKRRYPDRDPVEMHAQLWHRRLVCPGGGPYRWNDQWQTMESTVYGHPGQPQSGPRLPAALAQLQSGSFAVTFEEHGLSARMELVRRADAEAR